MAPTEPCGGRIRIGLKLVNQCTDVATLTRLWRAADDAGFHHLWLLDHLAPVFAAPDADILESWTLLAAAAMVTSRARLGVMVTCNTYRHPALLAKMAVTVDHLSGGRLEMGLGAGWQEPEHRMLGLTFDTGRVRAERLAEACRVLRALWTEDVVDLSGRYYQLRGAVANPKPVQRPHPPIWIGGIGPRRTLRIVAEHADVWNAFQGVPLSHLRALSALLDRYCAEYGRPHGAVRRSIEVRFDADDLAGTERKLGLYVDAGFTEIILIVSGEDAERHASIAAERLLPWLRCSHPLSGGVAVR